MSSESSESSQSDESIEAQERSDDQATGAYGGNNTNVGNPADSLGYASVNGNDGDGAPYQRRVDSSLRLYWKLGKIILN